MSIEVSLKDGEGSGGRAKVTSRGQVVTAPLDFSTFYNVTAGVINTAYNLVAPKTGKRFVITTIHLYANKNVGASDATVVLYESDSATSTTANETIINIEMLKQTHLILNGLNTLVTEGQWINVKTDDDDVFANIAGYFIDA